MAKDVVGGNAVFSPCGFYRYWLERDLRDLTTPDERWLVVIGLNGSTANAIKNDPTVTKECGFAKRWGYTRYVKVNAYGYVATKPVEMKWKQRRGGDVIGTGGMHYAESLLSRGGGLVEKGSVDQGNDYWLRRAIDLCMRKGGRLLVGWGQNIDAERQAAVAKMFAGVVDPYCLGINANGTPEHPLYIPYTRELQRWRLPDGDA